MAAGAEAPRRVAPLGPRDDPVALPTPALPPSKSDLNRRLVAAALLPGTTRVGPASAADDVLHLVGGLRDLGVAVAEAGGGYAVGSLDLADAADRGVFVGEGGTTSRFLVALASRRTGATTLTGGEQLGRRPVEPLLAALRALGCRADRLDGPAFAVRVGGPWTGGRCRVEVDRSSQFASALALAAPATGLELTWDGEPVSRPYLDLTLAVVAEAGGAVEGLPAGCRVRSGGGAVAELVAAPDASSATYPAALAALAGAVTLPGVGRARAQPDLRFLDLLAAMGARVTWSGDDARVAAGPLEGLELDATECPDLVPAFAVVAACARTPSRVTNAGHLRHKESDRLELLARGLEAFGVAARAGPDTLEVPPRPAAFRPDARPPVAEDHRMAMAFAVLARVAAGAGIATPSCVAKSWPGFWGWLDATG